MFWISVEWLYGNVIVFCRLESERDEVREAWRVGNGTIIVAHSEKWIWNDKFFELLHNRVLPDKKLSGTEEDRCTGEAKGGNKWLRPKKRSEFYANEVPPKRLNWTNEVQSKPESLCFRIPAPLRTANRHAMKLEKKNAGPAIHKPKMNISWACRAYTATVRESIIEFSS